jgi:hypothetical protein
MEASPDPFSTVQWLAPSPRGYATAGTDTGHEEEGGRRCVGAPPSGGDCRFWISWRSRDDGEGEGNRKGILRPNSARILFRRLFRRRAGGTDGSAVFPGYAPGGEEGGGWKPWIIRTAPGNSDGSQYVNGFFRYRVFRDGFLRWFSAIPRGAIKQLVWMPRFGQRTRRCQACSTPTIQISEASGSVAANSSFITVGAMQPSPENTIDYFQKVGYKLGPSLFGQFSVLPGKSPKDSVYLALETWVEKGVAPGRIIATNLKEGDPSHTVEMTRPLCPYPEVAKYKGAGDTNVAASFECEVGK